MTRKTTQEIYYQKSFVLARRCLNEARELNNPVSSKIMIMVNPDTGEQEEVLSGDYATLWSIKYHIEKWSVSTWRLMRASYRHLLASMVENGALTQERLAQIEKQISVAKGKKKVDLSRSTSGLRKKSITDEEYQALEKEIVDSNYLWGDGLLLWVRASLVTGLRPNEWETAKFDVVDGRDVLLVNNFKHNEERTHGPTRTFLRSSFSEGDVSHIDEHLAFRDKIVEMGVYDNYYRGCRDLLRYINGKLWPKRLKNINLYTGRHQFSANAKSTKTISGKERAVMMGHKSTKTSAEGYGKARCSNNGLMPKNADESALNRVVVNDRPSNRPLSTNKPD